MVKFSRILFVFHLVVICIVVTGCSRGPQKPPNFPKIYPCSITVTQDGKPLEGARVRFLPKNGTSEWVMMAQTDASGVAYMATHIQFPGVPVGDYKVLISKTEQTPSLFETNEPPKEGTPEFEVWKKGMEYEKRPNYALVNRDYGNEQKTPFEIKIEKGKNAASFEVGPPIRIKISGG